MTKCECCGKKATKFWNGNFCEDCFVGETPKRRKRSRRKRSRIETAIKKSNYICPICERPLYEYIFEKEDKEGVWIHGMPKHHQGRDASIWMVHRPKPEILEPEEVLDMSLNSLLAFEKEDDKSPIKIKIVAI